MDSKTDKRKLFGQRLKIALIKCKMKQVKLAEVAECTKQFISNVANGANSFNNEQFDKVYEVLCDAGLSDHDLNELNMLHIESRTGVNLDEYLKKYEIANPLIRELCLELEGMSDREIKDIITMIRTFKRKMINK